LLKRGESGRAIGADAKRGHLKSKVLAFCQKKSERTSDQGRERSTGVAETRVEKSRRGAPWRGCLQAWAQEKPDRKQKTRISQGCTGRPRFRPGAASKHDIQSFGHLEGFFRHGREFSSPRPSARVVNTVCAIAPPITFCKAKRFGHKAGPDTHHLSHPPLVDNFHTRRHFSGKLQAPVRVRGREAFEARAVPTEGTPLSARGADGRCPTGRGRTPWAGAKTLSWRLPYERNSAPLRASGAGHADLEHGVNPLKAGTRLAKARASRCGTCLENPLPGCRSPRPA
jgi:hypothetical protein